MLTLIVLIDYDDRGSSFSNSSYDSDETSTSEVDSDGMFPEVPKVPEVQEKKIRTYQGNTKIISTLAERFPQKSSKPSPSAPVSSTKQLKEAQSLNKLKYSFDLWKDIP